ncbi:MAG: tetratricopeptide repeat protein [Planctomycetes bacterium]|nr:tetratricopeptide repeat protein [Planctomycetota bacterium]
MKFPTSIFITTIVMLFLSAFFFNFIAQEKEAKYHYDEMHILASQQENINREIQTLSYKLNTVLQEFKNIRAEGVYLKDEMESVKKQINEIHSWLDNISAETQHLNEKRIKVVGFGLPLVPREANPENGKELLKVEDTLERQNITEHFQKAIFYQKNGELTKALQEYESILKIDSLNAEAHNNMGLLYQQKGEYNKALLSYRKAVSLKPDYNKARCNMGTVLYRQGRLEAAGMEFDVVLEKEPENVHALTNLAIIYQERGELEKARDLLLKALNLNGEFHEAHYNLALILEELGSIDEAIVHYCAFLKNSSDAYTSLTADVLKHLKALEKKSENIAVPSF